MPEATVNKDRQFLPWKDEIRVAEDFLIPTPAGNLVPAKYFYQRNFCVLIPATANPRHHFRPFDFGENVCHEALFN